MEFLIPGGVGALGDRAPCRLGPAGPCGRGCCAPALDTDDGCSGRLRGSQENLDTRCDQKIAYEHDEGLYDGRHDRRLFSRRADCSIEQVQFHKLSLV